MIEVMIIVMRAMMKFMSTVGLKMMGNCMVVLMKCLDMNLEYESWDDGGANSSSDSKMGTYGPSQNPLIIVIMGTSCDDQRKGLQSTSNSSTPISSETVCGSSSTQVGVGSIEACRGGVRGLGRGRGRGRRNGKGRARSTSVTERERPSGVWTEMVVLVEAICSTRGGEVAAVFPCNLK
ncbi:hypothetical protein Acr_28g0002080 [Actinidia rufa]|uniref:Uncharacterized protein n=1 Tax=Actinidia rufa TaxID=165716 RepID=A0A7J0H8S3_9ERIC|nr:hypothetical protein Acr_28g0002080 [Actinidia rufa]